ncbi:PiggyBac transposable element-derived protein [Phytophthora cactorum]|nr:PiggyBac transposable element-derived protein [Phytophthora cactorum]
MSRDRFAHTSRNLHFSSNANPCAVTDRAWKLRPVIQSLQERFQAMLPSWSSFNRMRAYMKDKPHKWGTKLFTLNCSNSAYCIW